ncbi:MAG: type II toxin-antitoxin system RelE/ParE family toxin [Gammaproteobacteria bacterium]|nr:type II toxin-antitoxin system RelE/ParE family toxin [Gammaproteobacteria bacterium]
MAQLVWTEPALSDLQEIAAYIAIENPGAASSLVKQVFTAVERLESHPRSGRMPPELKKSRYREIISGPCRIFYRPTRQRIYILHVMRSEQDLRNYILDARTRMGD